MGLANIDLDKDDNGIFPSSEANINFLLDSLNELSQAFDNNELRNKISNNSEYTNRLTKLREKLKLL